MATKKTILSVEVCNSIMEVLIACPAFFNRLAGFVHAVERYHRREAKKKRLSLTPDTIRQQD